MEFSNKNAVDRAKFGSKLSKGQNKERDLFVLWDLAWDRKHLGPREACFRRRRCVMSKSSSGWHVVPQSLFHSRLGWSFSSPSTLLLRVLNGIWRLGGPRPAPPLSPCVLFFVYLPWISWVNENWVILIIVFIQALILGKIRLKTHSFVT